MHSLFISVFSIGISKIDRSIRQDIGKQEPYLTLTIVSVLTSCRPHLFTYLTEYLIFIKRIIPQ